MSLDDLLRELPISLVFIRINWIFNMSAGVARSMDDFFAEIKKQYEPIVFLLFGSRAKGEELAGSDYDILLVSDKFKGVPFTDRLTSILKRWPNKEALECICLTPKEYEKSKNMISIINTATAEGVPL